MVDYFDYLYTSIVNKNKFLERIRYYSIVRFTIRLFTNIIFPIYFVLTKENKRYSLDEESHKNEGRIIVSLTTFPTRIGRVWLVIETILRQTKKPDKIILWLSMEQFPTLYLLPPILLRQKERGLDIRLVKGDIRSHKKYYYTLQEFPNDYLLTVDDDIFYRTNMIEDLFNISQKYPTSIICQRALFIEYVNEKIKPYSEWKLVYSEMESNCKIFFTTGGGTLLPPRVLYKDTLDEQIFLKLAPFADDIWLNVMSRLKGTNIVKTKYYTEALPIINLNNITLASKNLGENYNDIQINDLTSHYKQVIGVNLF